MGKEATEQRQNTAQDLDACCDTLPDHVASPATETMALLKSTSHTPQRDVHVYDNNSDRQHGKVTSLEVSGPGDKDGDSTTLLAARRKVNIRILPWMVAIIVFCYIDRTNLAYASLQLNCDLGFNSAVYGLGTSLFYLSYSFFQLPSNVLLVKFGCNLWLAVIMMVWGGIATGFAFIQSARGFYVLRFLLGVAEAGTFPGVFYYVKLFYSNSTITLPYTVIEVSAMASHILASPLAAALLSLDGTLNVPGWRWLFLMEGLPCTVLGLMLYWVLPADIESFKGLTVEERKSLSRDVAKDSALCDTMASTGLSWSQIKAGFCHKMMWYIASVSALKNVALFGIFYWTPSIIKALRDGSVRVTHSGVHPPVVHCNRHNSLGLEEVLLAAVPFGTAAVWASVLSFNSHRIDERPLHIAATYLFGALILLITGVSLSYLPLVPGLILLTLAIAGMYGGNSIIVAHLAHHANGPVAAVVLALNNAGGNVGSFIGSGLLGLFLQVTNSFSGALCVASVPILTAGLMALYMKKWDLEHVSNETGLMKSGKNVEDGEESRDLLNRGDAA